MRNRSYWGFVRVGVAVVVLAVVGPLGLAGRAQAQCAPVWAAASPLTSPSARFSAAMAFDSRRGVVVLFGGTESASGTTVLNDTWEWNGVTWTQRSPAAVPPARMFHAMAYDSARGVVVLFGGAPAGFPSLGSLLNDTWEWDGANWAQRTPPHSPPARCAYAMAYDSARGVAMLFGGLPAGFMGSGALLNDTWVWNGSDWAQRTPEVPPPARYGHAMAYDSVRHLTVLFGGAIASGNSYLADTWEWNGTNWYARTPATAPSGRYMHAMAYGTQGTTVLFGSYPNSTNETWQWDGSNWTQPTLPLAPDPRYLPAMAYDSARGAMVLFGGEALSGGPGNETWELREFLAGIAQQPINTIAVEGLAAILGVTPIGSGPFQYQWRKNGTPITGATMPMYLIPACCKADAAAYDVVVRAGACALTSAPATLSVRVRADLNGDGQVNCRDLGMFVSAWTGPGTPPAPCTLRGDVNCDGLVNNGDIDAFVLALTNSQLWATAFPNCDLDAADINGDGLVNNGDIDAFVKLLTGG